MTISQGREIGAVNSGLAVSLLFAAGGRSGSDVIRQAAQTQSGFSISLDLVGEPAASDLGSGEHPQIWLELLANGLTFDLVGLSPGPPSEPPQCTYPFALAANADASGKEAVTIQPGPHLTGGHSMIPVVRTLAWLAATLSGIDGLEAIAWHSARSRCDPFYFRDSVLRWVEGGVFPNLGLTSLAVTAEGGMQSEGLALFAGQELRIEPELMADKAAGAKIAIRLIDQMVGAGRIDTSRRIMGPDGRRLRLEPSANGRFVRVWRG